VLQHPQESRKLYGTARMLAGSVEHAKLSVGLSWRSLANAWGAPADPKRWGVLFVGTQKSFQGKDGRPPRILGVKSPSDTPLDGVVILDGNWKQAKTLWWRNPWLLRLTRLAVRRDKPSDYSAVRRQPRKECLATIEAAAEVLRHLERTPATAEALDQLFQEALERAQQLRTLPMEALFPSLGLESPDAATAP
jgi:DTW domain-containing protein YfiP